MKLSVYLMRDSVRSFKDILLEKVFRGGDKFVRLPPSAESLPYPCEAYIQVNKGRRPKWESFLRTAFQTSKLRMLNQSSSFVLLIKAHKRFFAVTLGFGFSAINPAVIEPRFGLMVAANWLTRLHGIEATAIDRASSNKKLYAASARPIRELDLNPNVDFIRRMEGNLPTNPTARRITGCDSCCITTNCDIESLGSVCKELFDRFASTDYKSSYAFLDNLVPLGRHDARIPEMEHELIERLKRKSKDRLSIACPEMPDEERLQHYRISCGASAQLDELTLEGIYEFIDDNQIEVNPNKIHVVGIGNDDSPVTRKRSLRDYLAAEIQINKDTFIFCNGEWFLAEADYVQKVRDEVASLPDLTATLRLAPIRNGESESQFNERIASVNDLLLMDKANFRIGGSFDKVEVCDLLSENRQLIFVKKMESSSTMSHLFAQGSVSAQLLRTDESYRINFNQCATSEWPLFSAIDDSDFSNLTVVYAIATRKTEPLAEGMFFFSLVNLLNHVRTIRGTGCKVGLCKIEYEDAPASPAKVSRRRRKKLVGTAHV